MNNDTYNNNTEIRIYQSLWKIIPLVAACIAIALVGIFIISDPRAHLRTKILGGWLNIIFFGCGGIAIFFVSLYNHIRHIPFLIIDEEKLLFYVQFKRTYQPIYFADVRRFRMYRMKSSRMILIDYKAASKRNKLKKASKVRQQLFNFNTWITGSMESIPCDNLTIKGSQLYEILNERLEKSVRQQKKQKNNI